MVTFTQLQKAVQNSTLLSSPQVSSLTPFVLRGLKWEKKLGFNSDSPLLANSIKELQQLAETAEGFVEFAEFFEDFVRGIMRLPRNISSEIHALCFGIKCFHQELVDRLYHLSYDLSMVCKQAEERWNYINKDTYPSYEFLEQVLPKQKEDIFNHIIGLDEEQWKLFLNNLDFFRVESTIKGSKDQQSYDAYKDARILCGCLHEGLEGLISYYAKPILVL